jgi:hypothetical protein
MATKQEKVLIVLGDLAERAAAKAKRRGISRSEYIRGLIAADLGDMPASSPLGGAEEPAMFELEVAPLEEGA